MNRMLATGFASGFASGLAGGLARGLARGLAPALALALAAATAIVPGGPARAQSSAQCGDFAKIRDAAGQKAELVRVATHRKEVDRKEVCATVTNFAAAEGAMLKFLEENRTWCGVPEQAVAQAKASHERTMKFKVAACTDAPAGKPKAPSLNEAIGGTAVDSSTNTSTGRGTFDTLTGNPLGR
jgi:hypothetical protein